MSPSLIVSIIAVIISGSAVYISWRTQNRLVDIENAREKDRLAEKKKAILTAQIVSDSYKNIAGGQTTRHKLQIDNSGIVEARNIKVTLDDKPLLEHPTIPQNTEEVTKVGPSSSFQYLLALSMGNYPPFNIEITWEDESGEPGKYSTTLTL